MKIIHVTCVGVYRECIHIDFLVPKVHSGYMYICREFEPIYMYDLHSQYIVALKKSFCFHRLKWNRPFRSAPFRSVPLYNRQAALPAKLRAKSNSLALCESVCAVFAFRCQCTMNSKNPAARANCRALFLSNGTDGNVAIILKRNGWKRKLFLRATVFTNLLSSLVTDK